MKLQSAVQVEAPPDRDAWNALVAGAPEATVFHTSAWAELWTREWRGARWVAFVLEDEAGYAGGIPAIVRNRGIGRTVFSMPYGTYGGPLLRPGHPDPAAARLELLLAFARRAGSRWTLRSEMTWYQGSVPEIIENGTSGYIVDSMDNAIEAAKKIQALNRSQVRKCFEQHFTAGRMAKEYLAIYERLSHRKKAPTPTGLLNWMKLPSPSSTT